MWIILINLGQKYSKNLNEHGSVNKQFRRWGVIVVQLKI